MVEREDVPVHFIGVSMPRSGHHLLARLLQTALQDDLFYCERYRESDCCTAVPCVRRGCAPVSFQKSHDFDLQAPTDVADCTYLIQHRDPVPMLLSAREHALLLEYGGAAPAAADEYAVWLGRQADYYVAFSQRWLAAPPPNSLIVEYDDLAANPRAVLLRVLASAGQDIPAARIDGALASTLHRAGQHGEYEYVRRSVQTSRFLDPKLLAIAESVIVDRVPDRACARVFDAVAYQDTVVGQVFEARRQWRAGDVRAAGAIVDLALRTAPCSGMLHHERAVLLQSTGEYAAARDALAAAAALLPGHPVILRSQIDVALGLGELAAARAAAEALVAAMPAELLDSVVLALARVHTSAPVGPADLSTTISALEAEIIRRATAQLQGARALGLAEARMRELAQTAEERLALIQALSCETARVREAWEQGAAQLQQKEREIDGLSATAQERLLLVEATHDELTRAQEENARLVAELDERGQVIAELAAVADERLQLIDELSAAGSDLRELLERLAHEAQEKEQIIGVLAATADERLRLIERLDADARRQRDDAGTNAPEYQSDRPTGPA